MLITYLSQNRSHSIELRRKKRSAAALRPAHDTMMPPSKPSSQPLMEILPCCMVLIELEDFSVLLLPLPRLDLEIAHKDG